MGLVPILMTNNHCRPIGLQGLDKSALQGFMGINIHRMSMTGPRQRHKVGVSTFYPDTIDLTLIHIILNLLESSVFPNDDRYRQLQFSGCQQFGHSEHKPTVPYQYSYRRFRPGQPGTNGVGQRVT